MQVEISIVRGVAVGLVGILCFIAMSLWLTHLYFDSQFDGIKRSMASHHGQQKAILRKLEDRAACPAPP